jgi:predicted nucleotidyltransferase
MNNDFNIDMNKVRSFLAEKDSRRRAALDDSFNRANADFDCIVKHIIKKYNPKNIWQWGSLLNRSRFSEISDIDIGLEGINDPQTVFSILGDAMQLTRFPVDIVQMENIGKINADYIRENGRCIYEHPR